MWCREMKWEVSSKEDEFMHACGVYGRCGNQVAKCMGMKG